MPPSRFSGTEHEPPSVQEVAPESSGHMEVYKIDELNDFNTSALVFLGEALIIPYKYHSHSEWEVRCYDFVQIWSLKMDWDDWWLAITEFGLFKSHVYWILVIIAMFVPLFTSGEHCF